MSQQALDLRRSTQILRRRKVLVVILVTLGILGGGAYAVLTPPSSTSTALVALPESPVNAEAGTTDRRNRSFHGHPRGDRDQLSGAVGRTA